MSAASGDDAARLGGDHGGAEGGRPTASAIKALLTRTLVALSKVKAEEAPIRDVEFGVASALDALYRAAELRVSDPVVFRDTVKAAETFAGYAMDSLAAPDDSSDAVLREIGEALDEVARALARPMLEWSGFGDGTRQTGGALALTNLPAIFAFARAPLFPVVTLPEDLAAEPARLPLGPADDSSVTALLARFPPAARSSDVRADWAQFGVAIPERQTLLDRARLCFEDVAGFANMRRTGDDLSWYRPRTEERLLARVDAIVACGTWVIPHLCKRLEDRPVPDPQMAWAAVFLCGSFDGIDAVDQVMRLVDTMPVEEPTMRDFLVDALSLAPHALIGPTLRPWLKSPVVWRREMAIEVLARRLELSAEEALAAAGDGEATIARSGVRGLARLRLPADVVPAVWRMLMAAGDEGHVRECMAAAVLHRSEAGVRKALGLVREGRAGYADGGHFVAIGSDEKIGLEALQAPAALARPDEALIEAMGEFGHVALVPRLLERLDGEAAMAAQAALALYRITGARITKDDPMPAVVEPGSANFPFTGGAQRPEKVVGLLPDRAAWTAWWNHYKAAANFKTRYRHGHPWSPDDALWEMEDESNLRPARVWAYRELVARTGLQMPFDPEHFVARQQNQIADLRSAIAQTRIASGEWTVRYRR